jgi:di/tricarboxylate transporter
MPADVIDGMTAQIALVLLIVLAAVVLFIGSKLRVDVVALLVLGVLVVTGLIEPVEALSGFSNPAVVTVWAVFILSGALTRTGVARVIGRQVMRVAGNGELRLILVIMLTAAILSAFMNNVGVAALMLPVVVEIAGRTRVPASKLLLPLAFGALLGGLTTLIGTPPNILASDALSSAGLNSFTLFDFAPVGITIMVAGILFMLMLGRRMLPVRDLVRETSEMTAGDLESLYQLQEQLLVLTVPDNSRLDGMSLAESQMGSIVDLNVLAIIRDGKTRLSPPPGALLRAGDKLIVVGEPGQLADLSRHRVDTLERLPMTVENAREAGIDLAEVKLTGRSTLIGHSLADAGFRQRHLVNVLAVRRGDRYIRRDLPGLRIEASDVLLVEGRREAIDRLKIDATFEVLEAESAQIYQLDERLLQVSIPAESVLVGRTLAESRLGQTFGLTVLQINRADEIIVMPHPGQTIRAGDRLLLQGSHADVRALRGLEELRIDGPLQSLSDLETADIGLAEVVLSPHTTKAGRTLRELNFREKYGLSVLAIWRAGETYRDEISEMPLRFGDALLTYGLRSKIKILGHEADFIVLAEEAQETPRLGRAPIAVAIMAGVLASVLVGWLPIAIAAIIGGTLMVITGCLTMEEAYRYIEWPAVFLIAAMLPLGIALETSGAASYLTKGMIEAIGAAGPLAVLAGLFILGVLASQVMPNAAVVVLMAPIAIEAAADMDVSPYTFMMGIAIAASASFMSPISHPANILVMGPGGYRFSDYIKIGLPLTLIVLLIVLLILPVFWPF